MLKNNHAVSVTVCRRTLLGQVSSRKATEEALLSGFDTGKKREELASIKRTRFQVSDLFAPLSPPYHPSSLNVCRSR